MGVCEPLVVEGVGVCPWDKCPSRGGSECLGSVWMI